MQQTPTTTDFDIIKLLQIIVVAFFAAFARELNDAAKKPETFLLFLSEVLLSGTCGFLAGILVFNYTHNDYLVMVTAGVSGLLGTQSIKLLLGFVKIYLKAMKALHITESEIIEVLEENSSLLSRDKGSKIKKTVKKKKTGESDNKN